MTEHIDLRAPSSPPPPPPGIAGPSDAWATSSASPLDRISGRLRRRGVRTHDEPCTALELDGGGCIALRLEPVPWTTWKSIVQLAGTGGDAELKGSVTLLQKATSAIVVDGQVYPHPTGTRPMAITDKVFHQALGQLLTAASQAEWEQAVITDPDLPQPAPVVVKDTEHALMLMFHGGDWEVNQVAGRHVARSQGIPIDGPDEPEVPAEDPFEATPSTVG